MVLLFWASIPWLWSACAQETSATLEQTTPQADPSMPGNPASQEPPLVQTDQAHQATFSAEVDTASYSYARRSLRQDTLPEPGQIHAEEFLNFFRYQEDWEQDSAGPFALSLEAARSPFAPDKQLLRVALRGATRPEQERAPTNLVFLIDDSGSMSVSHKMGLVQYGLKALLDSLRPQDTLALVTYAGHDRVALPPTPVSRRGEILEAIDALGEDQGNPAPMGLETAWRLASESMQPEGINRVVLCTDGDFSLGLAQEALLERASMWAQRGVPLLVMGYRDDLEEPLLERLRQEAGGDYAFVQSRAQALRALEQQLGGLQVLARDVQLQVILNPALVRHHLPVGYEDRAISGDASQDLEAALVASGHTLTTYLEVDLSAGADADPELELARVRVLYRQPEGSAWLEQQRSLTLGQLQADPEGSSRAFRLGAAVAEFGRILRQSPHTQAQLPQVRRLAQDALGDEPDEDQIDLLDLMDRADLLLPQSAPR